MKTLYLSLIAAAMLGFSSVSYAGPRSQGKNFEKAPAACKCECSGCDCKQTEKKHCKKDQSSCDKEKARACGKDKQKGDCKKGE